MANRWGADSYIRGQVESHYNSEPSSLYAEGLENGKAELLLLLRGLLAFGAEFLALLAVKSLGVGLLGAFERRGGARLGHLFVGSGGCCRIALGGGGGLARAGLANSKSDARAVEAAREYVVVMEAPRVEGDESRAAMLNG